MDEKVLEIASLRVSFRHGKEWQPAVENVSFSLFRGRTLGIVGESGSGKSVTSMSVMQLLPTVNCRVDSGNIRFFPSGREAVDLLQLSDEEMRQYRGRHIAMVFQEPMTSLNPVQRCGRQVVEMIRQHESVPFPEARERVLQLFSEVMLPRPEKIFDSYPHEISGGQKQRVMIAMALACHPDVLIADEPTTALDVTVQQTILQLLRTLQERYHIGIVFISHDLGVVGQIADDIAVMYRGQIVEQGDAHQILHNPQHPYTQGLLACKPPLDSRPRRLSTVEDFLARKEGSADQQAERKENHINSPKDNFQTTPLLRVRNLDVTYTLERDFLGRPKQQLRAVDGISFDIYRGETLGLVGESGCGKSTLGRAIMQLVEHSAGSVEYDGQPLDRLSARQRRLFSRRVQIVFQDPYSSLNPRLTIGEAISEPLRCHGMSGGAAERRASVLELMQQVGLHPEWYDRYPHEFSGGQRQRVCIARALIMKPELVICDESVSALDVSVQAQVLNLLNDLKERHGYTYLFITHDLSVVKFFSDRIMVMQQGHLVESAPADELYAHPQQPYTRQLIDAIPRID